MDDEQDIRYAAYKQMELPEIYWDVRPLTFINRKKVLVRVWDDLWQGCSRPNTFGAILETDKLKIGPAIAAAFLKWGSARRGGGKGKWIYFPDLVHMAGSVKWDREKWAEYTSEIINCKVVSVVNMDVSRMVDISFDIHCLVYDFFQKLFWKKPDAVLIVTPNDVNKFEAVLGSDTSSLIASNIGVWREL